MNRVGNSKYSYETHYMSCLAAMLLVTNTILTSCAPAASTKAVVKQCVLPADQAGTLSGRWKIKPIPVAFQQGAFSNAEMAAIMAAADVWNGFYSASLGIARIIDYGTSVSSPRLTSSTDTTMLCPPSQAAILPATASSFLGAVNIYKRAAWPADKKDAIALTSFCRDAGTPLMSLTNAMMEVNYAYFFTSGKRQPDLTSIFVHEFGHLVGLDHSCDSTGRTGFPICSATELPSSYISAVMYPVVLFDTTGVGEVRQDLNENDEGRGNCLYAP